MNCLSYGLWLIHGWYYSTTTSIVYEYVADAFFYGKDDWTVVFFAMIAYRVSRFFCKIFLLHRLYNIINFALSLSFAIASLKIWNLCSRGGGGSSIVKVPGDVPPARVYFFGLLV